MGTQMCLRIKNQLILLISLYIPFTNVKGNQSNRLILDSQENFQTQIDLSRRLLDGFQNFQNFPSLFFLWAIHFCHLQMPETKSRDFSSVMKKCFGKYLILPESRTPIDPADHIELNLRGPILRNWYQWFMEG